MELLIDVSPESFDPAPKIDSAVVRMIPVNTVSARRTISSISPNWANSPSANAAKPYATI